MTTAWIKKITLSNVLLCGIIYMVFATIVHFVESMLTMPYYQMPEYFGLWSKLMMPTAGPPPLNFFLISLIFSFITGLSLALIYYYVRDLLPKKFWPRVLFFADLMIATAFIFSTLPMYLMFNVPIMLLISWFISEFVILTVTSYTLVRTIK